MGMAVQSIFSFYSFIRCIFYLEIEACRGSTVEVEVEEWGVFVVSSLTCILLGDMRRHQQCDGIVHVQAVGVGLGLTQADLCLQPANNAAICHSDGVESRAVIGQKTLTPGEDQSDIYSVDDEWSSN